MLDVDTINQIVLEQRHQEKEENALKNRILNMSNIERKQELWNKYFPHFNYETDLIF